MQIESIEEWQYFYAKHGAVILEKYTPFSDIIDGIIGEIAFSLKQGYLFNEKTKKVNSILDFC